MTKAGLLVTIVLAAVVVYSCSGDQDSINGPRLSELSLWAVDTMSDSTPPEFAELPLKPAFRGSKGKYEAEVGYGVKSLHILAWASLPPASILATQIMPEGEEKEITTTFVADHMSFRSSTSPDGTKTSQTQLILDGADLTKVTEQDAEFMRILKPLRVGETLVRIKVAGEKDAQESSTYTINVTRSRPQLDSARALQDHFRESVRIEDWSEVVHAINSGASVNESVEVDDKSLSAVAFAAVAGQDEAVALMIEAGADVNTGVTSGDRELPSGVSPLMMAVAEERVGTVRLLVDAGADINHALNSTDEQLASTFRSNSGIFAPGTTALSLAAGVGNTEIVSMLVDAGAGAETADQNDQDVGSTGGISALLRAVANENEEIARILIGAGANVNQTFPEQTSRAGDATGGISALMIAINKSNEGLARILIEAGADLNYQIPGERRFGSNPETAGLTALLLTVTNDQPEMARLLIEAGANVDQTLPEQTSRAGDATGGISALMIAINKSNEGLARILIEAGADLNYQIPGGQPFGSNPETAGLTALLLTVTKDQPEMARLLIEAGANVDQTFPEQTSKAGDATGGVAALMLAVDRGYTEMVRVLLDGGADLNYEVPGERPFGKNPETAGLTALRIATAKEDEELVKLLLVAGASD